MDESLHLEIWDRLIQGLPLEDLPLEQRDGRLNLNGLELPDATTLRRFRFSGHSLAEVSPSAVFQGVTWRDLDFTGSKLKELRLSASAITNCRFDRCQLQGSRLWSTTFTDCSFRKTNLRGAMLGGVEHGRRNVFLRADFSEANLSETIYKAASFERCLFRNAKLVKIDFQTSAFVDAVFAGELRDVLFYERGFEGESFPANAMINVDFSQSTLHDVGFRGLKLDRVKLPEDADHLIIKNPVAILDRLVRELETQSDPDARKLTAFLNIDRKWMPPDRHQTVINLQDLAETLGEEAVARLRTLLR